MVRKAPRKKKFLKSITSLDSFANQSSGCHTIWCYAARQYASWGQRYVRWHQGKGRLEICHVQLHTIEEEQWVLFHVLPCVLSFSQPVFLYFFIFPSVSMSILQAFLSSSKKWDLRSWCPEGSFVTLSHLSQVQPPSSLPRARNEKMESAFCLG